VILLDTHVVLWLAFQQSRLSPRARATIEQARNNSEPMAICAISLLEISTAAAKGRLGFATSTEAFLQQVESLFVVLPITARACARTISLPETYPKDPADRIIAATALVEGLPLVTADREIHASKALRTIW
jgi:PIN domain nuclease of toxin-antitoxin system